MFPKFLHKLHTFNFIPAIPSPQRVFFLTCRLSCASNVASLPLKMAYMLPLHHSPRVRAETEVRTVYNSNSQLRATSISDTTQRLLVDNLKVGANTTRRSALSSSLKLVHAAEPPPPLPDAPLGLVSRLHTRVDVAAAERDAAEASDRRMAERLKTPRFARPRKAGDVKNTARPTTGLVFPRGGVPIGCVIAQPAPLTPRPTSEHTPRRGASD